MEWDEQLVSYIKALADVISITSARVYHLEVFQAEDSQSRYPCIVYQITNDVGKKETGGTINVYAATVEVTILSKLTSDVRTLGKALAYLSTEAFDDVLIATPTKILTIDIEDDMEMNIFAQEQQERGYETSSMVFNILHEGK